MSPERDDYEDDDERDEFASRSIFSAGWFRAVLVLTVLAIVVVISLPYLLNWFEPTPPPRVAKLAEPLTPMPSAAPSPPAVTPAPAPATPIAAPAEIKPAPPAPAPMPKAVGAPPTAPAPAPKSAVEKAVPPASSEPARKAVPEKKTASKGAPERPPAKAAEIQAKIADKPPAPTRVAAKADVPSRPAALASAKGATDAASGSYWIQLGAFKEQKNADLLAKSLRDAGFPVQVTPIARGGGGENVGLVQRHELFVTDASVERVNAALKGQGTAQTVPGGVAVKPSFSLQEAMTASKRLTDQGLKVVIRPAGGLDAAPPPGQGGLHAVRAGAYPNRTSALAARDDLAAKGHQGFLSEGPAR